EADCGARACGNPTRIAGRRVDSGGGQGEAAPMVMVPAVARQVQVSEIVDEMGAEVDHIARVLTDAIHEHLSELDDDLRAGTFQSTRSNLGMIVTMLREGAAPSATVAPAEALGYVREYVRRGLGLELLQRA